jgi:hypothetical protein
MYSNADIDSLSVGQLRKLLKGGAVRVRCGSGMKLGLSAPQHKKLMSAHKKGKMMTVTLDPYQAQMHGQGLFGDIGNFFSRTVPSTLIHQGLPEAGSVLGGLAGEAIAPELGPVSGFVGSKLGRMAGKKLADETGRRTGYGVKKRMGRGMPLEDQSFSLSDVVKSGKHLFGKGVPLEDQQFSLSDVAKSGKRLFGGKVKGSAPSRRGKGMLGNMMKMVAPQVKKVAKEVATKLAHKAGSHVLHNVLPSASEQLGGMAGDYMGVQGGKSMGKLMGQMLEQEVASRTGLGMKMKRGRPKKGGALMVAGMR